MIDSLSGCCVTKLSMGGRRNVISARTSELEHGPFEPNPSSLALHAVASPEQSELASKARAVCTRRV